MPLIRRPVSSRVGSVTHSDVDTYETETLSTSDTVTASGNDDYSNDEEMGESRDFNPNSSARSAESILRQHREARRFPSRPESHNGQPLVPNGADGPSQSYGPTRQFPLPRRFQPSQESIQEHPPSRYPNQRVHYASGNTGSEEFSRRRGQSANSYDTYTQESMPRTWDPEPHNQWWPPTSPPSFPGQHHPPQSPPSFYPSPPIPPPSSPPQTVPSSRDPRPDPEKMRLEAELAAYKAREDELRAKEERQKIENQIRQELDTKIQEMKEQLKKAKQGAAREIEQARLQGERDAREKFERDRQEKIEKRQQLAEQKREMKRQVRAELEAERQAEIVEQEEEERRFRELERRAMESVLETLEDPATLSRDKVLLGPEMDKNLVRAELRSSITSRLRQSRMVSEPRRESDCSSSTGQKSRSSSRSRGLRHQAECESVTDITFSRPQSRSSHVGGQENWEGPLPPAPDVPRAACDSDEGMARHPSYTHGNQDFTPDYLSQQHDPRMYEERDFEYQIRPKLSYQDLITHVVDDVMHRLRVPTNWHDPTHTAPYDHESGQRYPAPEEQSYRINHPAPLIEEELLYGEIATTDSNGQGSQLENAKPFPISRPFKPRHLRGRPIEEPQFARSPSITTSLHPLPYLTDEESQISPEDQLDARISTFPQLVETDTTADSDCASVAGSDSTIFHEAPESMTEYSTNQSLAATPDYTRASSGGGECESEPSNGEDQGRVAVPHRKVLRQDDEDANETYS